MKPVQCTRTRGRLRFTQIVALTSFALWPALAHAQENLAEVGERVPTLQTSPVFAGGDRPSLIGFPLPPVSTPASFWGSADLLLWHASGTPGNTGTFGTALGGSLGAGMWLNREQRLGLEANGLFLSDRNDERSNLMRLYDNTNHQAQSFFNTRPPESGGLDRVLEWHWPTPAAEHRR